MNQLALAQILLLFMLASCTEEVTPPPVPAPAPAEPTTLSPQKPTEQSSAVLPDFSKFKDVKKKKEAFFSFMHPHIKSANDKVWEERQRVEELKEQMKNNDLTPDDIDELNAIADRYSVKMSGRLTEDEFKQLLLRIDVIPASLILAQAANESAWGTSRFAREGRNLFGIWCYTPGCGLTPKRRNANAKHEVRVFDTFQDGIAYYIHNLNTGQAYRRLRDLRAGSRAEDTKPTGIQVAPGLIKYSERGQAYVDEIRRMIRQNNLSRFLTDRERLESE